MKFKKDIPWGFIILVLVILAFIIFVMAPEAMLSSNF